MFYSLCPKGDVGEQGDKGPIGKAVDGPVGDQGHQGMHCILYCVKVIFLKASLLCDNDGCMGMKRRGE